MDSYESTQIDHVQTNLVHKLDSVWELGVLKLENLQDFISLD